MAWSRSKIRLVHKKDGSVILPSRLSVPLLRRRWKRRRSDTVRQTTLFARAGAERLRANDRSVCRNGRDDV
jgi:hypothetical protein